MLPSPPLYRDYWARFEKFVKDVSKSCKDVYVVTGPLWMPTQDAEGKWVMKHDMIGEEGLLVLPHTWPIPGKERERGRRKR
jgi:endonuclease G